MANISVLLPVFNEAKVIRACLETVKWADEILLVDSFSTDESVEIGREYGARVLQHEYINSASQKNWAIPQCRYEWVLQIDADERLEPELQQEIIEILLDPPADIDGYRINFKHYLLGKWIKVSGLYPEYHLRLFRRDFGRFQDREVDAHVIVPGNVDTLHNHILHFGTESLSPRLNSMDRYTRYESDERAKQGQHFSWFNLTIRPIGVFMYYFFYRLGFLEGVRGLILAFLKMEFIFWTYAKLWEKKWRKETEQ